MKLNEAQQRIVSENMGLVGKVIKDKVHGVNQLASIPTMISFQIGCIGLCKAAATDRGGCFSTYAYRLIWNEICAHSSMPPGVRRQNVPPIRRCYLAVLWMPEFGMIMKALTPYWIKL